ncbi:hypothetical protein OHV13_03800 [Kitasatospora purpeofusca]|uniref:hypothetical protein n=1 Tax=Kitasatospora purpeofusca TaxID=67352 RepID=UPI0032504453
MTTDNHHYGDRVTQYGDHNTGIVKNYGTPDLGAALRAVVAAVAALRGQVPPEDGDAIDRSLAVLGTAGAGTGDVRRALAQLAGIAVAAGPAGNPALESARTALELLHTQ